MSRVKFNVNTEYAYLQNFKILQSMYLQILPCRVSLTYTPLNRCLHEAPDRAPRSCRVPGQMQDAR